MAIYEGENPPSLNNNYSSLSLPQAKTPPPLSQPSTDNTKSPTAHRGLSSSSTPSRGKDGGGKESHDNHRDKGDDSFSILPISILLFPFSVLPFFILLFPFSVLPFPDKAGPNIPKVSPAGGEGARGAEGKGGTGVKSADRERRRSSGTK